MTTEEIHAVCIRGNTTATVLCPAGDFHEDAMDAADVPAVLAHAAMHAMSEGPGHEVREHVSRDMIVYPVI